MSNFREELKKIVPHDSQCTSNPETPDCICVKDTISQIIELVKGEIVGVKIKNVDTHECDVCHSEGCLTKGHCGNKRYNRAIEKMLAKLEEGK